MHTGTSECALEGYSVDKIGRDPSCVPQSVGALDGVVETAEIVFYFEGIWQMFEIIRLESFWKHLLKVTLEEQLVKRSVRVLM